MASLGKPALDDSRRSMGSPKLKGRENAKDTLCRNVTIYGKCRYEDKGCAFNHDPTKFSAMHQTDSNSSSKKGLNVDSPSFTPSLLSTNDTSSKKTTTISPKAASAAPFLPKSVTSRSNTSTPSIRQETATPDWSVPEIQDFVPQSFDTSQVVRKAPAVIVAGKLSNIILLVPSCCANIEPLIFT